MLGTSGPQSRLFLNALTFRGALRGRAITPALCNNLDPGDGPRGRWGQRDGETHLEGGGKPASSGQKSSEPLFVSQDSRSSDHVLV